MHLNARISISLSVSDTPPLPSILYILKAAIARQKRVSASFKLTHAFHYNKKSFIRFLYIYTIYNLRASFYDFTKN